MRLFCLLLPKETMIAALSGVVTEISEQTLILECFAVSFSIFVPNATIYQLGQNSTLKTYLHWNQEHGFSLFGFQDEAQKLFFLELISCSGVGPRLALSVLAHAPISVLCGAIKTSDTKLFTEISGIGQKKAEQVILHMKHALKTLEPKLMLRETDIDTNANLIRDLEQTLLALQYSRTEIYEALKIAKQEQQKDQSEAFDVILRKTLRILSIQRGTR
jgi:holliday junction DNA helicase RuvA